MLIDTLKEKTVLDKQATVATGNLLREGEGYKALYFEQQTLVDSLFKQSSLQRKENKTYRYSIVPKLEQLANEKDRELKYTSEIFALKEDQYKSKLKRERRKKWSWLGGGIVIGLGGFLLLAN